MSTQTSSGIGKWIVGAVAIVLAVTFLPRLGDAIRGQDDETTVEFAGFWLPAENHTRFEVQIGDRVEVLRPAGTAEGRDTLGYAHYGSARPGTPVSLTVESDPEQPTIISECYIAFLDGTEIPGEIIGEGSRCHAAAVVPPN